MDKQTKDGVKSGKLFVYMDYISHKSVSMSIKI